MTYKDRFVYLHVLSVLVNCAETLFSYYWYGFENGLIVIYLMWCLMKLLSMDSVK